MKKTSLCVFVAAALAAMSFSFGGSRLSTEGLVLVYGKETFEKAWVQETDISFDGDDFDEVAIPGYESDGGENGTTVEICPGTGVHCKVVVVAGNEVMVYSARKTRGGPDILVHVTEG